MKSDSVRFALLSLGRCGTTMLQNLINSHPLLYLSEECHWMHGLIGPGLMFHQFAEANSLATRQLPQDSKWWEAIKALNRVLLAEQGNKKCGLQFIGPNNLSNLRILFNTYPDLPVIILTRDPRSLLHSMYRTGIGFPDAGNQLLDCVNNIPSFTSNYMVLQYEDFYRNAPAAIEALCDFLCVEQHPAMLKSLENIVSHGESSALETPTGIDRWRDNLTTEQLYPLLNQQTTIEALAYPLDAVELEILTAFKPTPDNLASYQVELLWERTEKHAEVFSTPARGNSIGIIELLSPQAGVTVCYRNKMISPSSHLGKSYLFDLRNSQITPLDRKQHQNYKQIDSLRSIVRELIDKQVYIYSAGQETRDFLERNPFVGTLPAKTLSIEAVIDRAPFANSYTWNNLSQKLVTPHQLSVRHNDFFLVTTLRHHAAGKATLLDAGATESQIRLVI